MKKLFALTLIFAAFSFGVNAQTTKTSKSVKSETVHTDSKDKKGKMAQRLNLTNDQQSRMKEVQQSFKTKKDAIKNDASLSQSEKMEKLKALHAEKKRKHGKDLNKRATR